MYRIVREENHLANTVRYIIHKLNRIKVNNGQMIRKGVVVK